MTIGSHIEQLKNKHRKLSETVENAQRAPGADALEVAKLKKQKLLLKEEIARLSAG